MAVGKKTSYFAPTKVLKTCSPSGRGEVVILDTFIHVIILLTVLFLLFKFLVTSLETEELESQIKNAVEDHLPSLYAELDKSNNGAFKEIVQKMKSANGFKTLKKYYSKKDQATENWNDAISRETIIIIVALILGFIGAWATLSLSCGKCPPIGQLIVENIILFTLIGCVEAFFFYKIAMHYSPVAPSYLTETLIRSLKEELESVNT